MKAVGEVGSTSDFSAVEDFPKIWAVAGVLICRDNLGRLGGDEFDGERVMIDELLPSRSNHHTLSQDPKIWQVEPGRSER